MVCRPLQPRTRAVSTPRTATGVGTGVGKWPKLKLRVGKGNGKMRWAGGLKVDGGPKTARRVSFGGWEVR